MLSRPPPLFLSGISFLIVAGYVCLPAQGELIRFDPIPSPMMASEGNAVYATVGDAFLLGYPWLSDADCFDRNSFC